MGWLTTLSNFAELVKRLLARWDRYDQERKQLRREERRAAVSDDPSRAFADLFGQPDGVSERPVADLSHTVRADAAKAPVEPKQ